MLAQVQRAHTRSAYYALQLQNTINLANTIDSCHAINILLHIIQMSENNWIQKDYGNLDPQKY